MAGDASRNDSYNPLIGTSQEDFYSAKENSILVMNIERGFFHYYNKGGNQQEYKGEGRDAKSIITFVVKEIVGNK